jgi:hypothetical protein
MIALLLWFLASWRQGLYEVPVMPVTSFVPSDYNFEVLDHWPYGSGFSVLLDGNILFYTNGAVLQTGEVNASGKVIWLSELRFSGLAYTMVKSGDRLYVAVDDQGVAVVDISLPYDPQLVNLFPTGGRVFGLTTRGDTLYTTMGSMGLEIYDCRDALNPEFLGSLTGFNLRSLELVDTLLYATRVDYGLVVLDVADPHLPVFTAGVQISGQHYGLALDTSLSLAVVCSFDGGLNIFDISDPPNLAILKNLQVFTAWSVDIQDSFAYVISWDDSVHVIDLLSKEEVGGVGFDTPSIWPYDISVEGDYGALAGYLGSWWVFDVSDYVTPFLTDGASLGGPSQVTAYNDDWIVLGMLGSRLAFFPRDDSLVPAFFASTGDWPRDLEIHADTLYVAESWEGFALYSMSDPLGQSDEVSLVSRLVFEGVHVWALDVDSSFAYLACGDSGLIVVDLSNPTTPSEKARINLDARALSILKSGDTLYVGFEESGIAVVDISVPSSPLLLEIRSTAGGVLDMILRDTVFFIAQATEGAAIYEAGEWRLLSTIPTQHVTFALALEEDRLFLAEGTAGICAYDISDPTLPHRVGSLNTGGESRDILSLGDTLLLADGYDGLLKLLFLGLGIEEHFPVPASVIEVWPNPFSSMLWFSRPVEARLYDGSGRLQGDIRGSGFDASGLLPGVYFICGQHFKRKVVKVSQVR